MSELRDVLLVIADISGYTRFMVATATELRHGQAIVTALLEAVLERAELPSGSPSWRETPRSSTRFAAQTGSRAIWGRASSSSSTPSRSGSPGSATRTSATATPAGRRRGSG